MLCYLSCLLLLLATLSAEAFAPLSIRHGLNKLPSTTTPRRSPLSSTNRCLHLVSESTTKMWAVQDDDDENESQDVNIPTKKKIVPPQAIRDVWNAISLFWSYTITFLGISLSFGLLLNLFGYAYIIDRDEGLRVDTIQQLRTEQQFRAEANRLANEQRPPSALPK